MDIPNWVTNLGAAILFIALFIVPLLLKHIIRSPKRFDAKKFVNRLSETERDGLLSLLALTSGDTAAPSPSEARRRFRAEHIRLAILNQAEQSSSVRAGVAPSDSPWLAYVVILNNGVPADSIADTMQTLIDLYTQKLPQEEVEPIILSEAFSNDSLSPKETSDFVQLVLELIRSCVQFGADLEAAFPGRWKNEDFTVAVCALNGAMVWELDPIRDAARILDLSRK